MVVMLVATKVTGIQRDKPSLVHSKIFQDFKKQRPSKAILRRINLEDSVATAPFQAAITDPHAKAQHRYHLYGHHDHLFDKDVPNNLARRTNLDQHSRKQHFVSGKPLCGSASNGLIYGTSPATAPNLGSRYDNNNSGNDEEADTTRSINGRKPAGLLYGFEDTKVGKPVTRKEKGNLPTWMQDKTSAELRKREMQAKEIEEDIARSRLEKANHLSKKYVEQRKDLEMLQNYKPWGKPGGGAPMAMGSERTTVMRTRDIDRLAEDRMQVLPLGKPGGGAPNRTESGRIAAKMHADNHIRLQAHKDGRPVAYLPLKNDTAHEYRTELDRQAEESRIRRYRDREDDFRKDIETLKYDPYGRPGAGAPLKDEDGSPRTGLPLQLSNNIYELRSTEPRHGHAFNGNGLEDESQALLSRSDRLTRKKPAQVARDSEDMDQGFQFGMPGGGAPIRDSRGEVLAHAPRTLIKDRTGAIVKSPTKSTKSESQYFPFGKPGAGAPIRDGRGNVQAAVAGKVDKAKLGRLDDNSEKLAKREYLETLKKMQEEQEMLRNKERSERLVPAAEVSSWIKRGVVGQPKYDPYTHEIRADPLVTSDVTKQRMNIHQQASNRSRDYHDQLDEFSRQREAQRQKEILEQRQKSVEHARTMESVWGRPGNGAPLNETKRAKVDMNPADYGMKYRDN